MEINDSLGNDVSTISMAWLLTRGGGGREEQNQHRNSELRQGFKLDSWVECGL